MDTGRRVVAVQVEVHDHRRGQRGVQLGPTQPQAAHEAQPEQHGAVRGQERGGQHGVAPPVPHHPDDTGPHQQGKRQPADVGDTPHLQQQQNKWIKINK